MSSDTVKSKVELIAELSRILMVQNVSWHLLPQTDLERLVSAFNKLKTEFEQFFQVMDELEAFIDDMSVAMVPQSELWRDYVV
jgi:hypothetical protein